MRWTDEEIEALTHQERCDLLAKLGATRRVPISAAYARRVRRWRMGLMVPGTIILIPWTVYLAAVLPTSYTTENWRLTWVGFDIILVTLMALTILLGWRRRQLVLLTAFATGLLLACDAWFDVTTAAPADRRFAVASALFAELPLAAVLIGGALRFVRLIAMQQGLLSTGEPLWRLSLPVAYEDDEPAPTTDPRP